MVGLDFRPQTLAWAIPFLIVWFAGSRFWPYTLGVAGAAALLARRRTGRRRAVWLVVAGLLVLDCFVFRVLTGARNRASEAHAEWMRETLSHPAVVDGLALPAGTAIVWRNDEMIALQSLTLPSPTPLLGVMLTGELNLFDTPWTGTLAADSDIGEWRCRAGAITLWGPGRLFECTLAAARTFRGKTVPAGAAIGLDPDDGTPTVYRRSPPAPSAG